MSKIKLKHSSGNSMSIGAPATNPASDLELKLPATVGTAGQALVNSSTAGTLEFATVVKSGVNTVSTAGDVGYEFRNTNTTAGFGFKIKGGGTDADRYILRMDDAAGNERARISAAGYLLVSRTSSIHGGKLSLDYTNGTTAGMAIKDTQTSGTGVPMQIVNGSGTIVGSITQNQSNAAFNTSSDYRLKENVVAISDGITRIKTLKPSRFNWISDPSNTTIDGFLAHEVTAVPEAVQGTKDAVASEDIDSLNIEKDDPIYQQIDQSKLVPLLTAALQEAIAKVETLETEKTKLQTDLTALTTRVAALEAA